MLTKHAPADHELAPTAQRSTSVNSSETPPKRLSADSATALGVSRRLASTIHPDEPEPAIHDIRSFHPLTIISTGIHGHTSVDPPDKLCERGVAAHRRFWGN